MRRFSLAVVMGAAALTASASPAAGAVTIGQVPAATPPAACSTQRDTTQPTVTSGNAYVVPNTGGIVSWTVTSWSTFASADMGQSFTMKLFRQVAGMTYTVVGHDGPHDLTPSALNTFPANVAAKPGDVLGLNSGSNPADDACNFTVPMDTALTRSGDLADGESGDFGTTTPFWRVNITAVVEPDCDNDRLGDESQDKDVSSCSPAAGGATCKGNRVTIIGTPGNDVRSGTPGRDVMAGQGGNDRLSGLAGKDLICGGAGKDKLKGGPGNDFLSGQKGNDKLVGQKGKDKLSGKKGKDVCVGGAGTDKAKGCENTKSI
jgi:Ca2+-binding RTX toxin-like protein